MPKTLSENDKKLLAMLKKALVKAYEVDSGVSEQDKLKITDLTNKLETDESISAANVAQDLITNHTPLFTKLLGDDFNLVKLLLPAGVGEGVGKTVGDGVNFIKDQAQGFTDGIQKALGIDPSKTGLLGTLGAAAGTFALISTVGDGLSSAMAFGKGKWKEGGTGLWESVQSIGMIAMVAAVAASAIPSIGATKKPGLAQG